MAYVVAFVSPNPTPVPAALTRQAKEIVDYLLAQKAKGVVTVKKSTIGQALGIKPKQRLTKVFGSYLFEQWLENNGIVKNHNVFVLSG